MKFLNIKIYIVFFVIIILSMDIAVLAKDSKIKYTREDISNYFLGVFSADQDHNNNAFKYLKKVQSLIGIAIPL